MALEAQLAALQADITGSGGVLPAPIASAAAAAPKHRSKDGKGKSKKKSKPPVAGVKKPAVPGKKPAAATRPKEKASGGGRRKLGQVLIDLGLQ